MIRLLLLVAALVLVFYTLRWFTRAKLEDAKRAISTVIITIVIAVLVILAVTGRLHWLIAMIGAAVPIAMRLWRAWQAYRWLKDKTKPATPPKPTPNAIDDAYQTLGLQPGAGKELIIKAHRQLIRDAHPDRGGSDEQAQRLNAAKELLLKSLGDQ